MELDLHHVFGFCAQVKSGVTFYDDDTLFFMAGQMCILYNIKEGTQKCFKFPERNEITAVTKSAQSLLAVALKGKPPVVCVFNIFSTSKKMFSFDQVRSEKYIWLSVSTSLQFFAAQGGPPDWMLVIWNMHSRDVAATFYPAYEKVDSTVFEISFHAGKIDELIAVGNKVLRLYKYEAEQKVFSEYVFETYEKFGIYNTIAWPHKENLAIGTSDSKIIIFCGVEPSNEINVSECETELNRLAYVENSRLLSQDVTSLISTSKGIICLFGSVLVVVYEENDMADYNLKQFFYIPPQREHVPSGMTYDSEIITSLSLNRSETIIVATTNFGQILYSKFGEESKQQIFQSLLQRQHNEPIIDMDVAQRRPFIATCSMNSIIIWNYISKSQELWIGFKEEILSIAFHPTGLFMAVGYKTFSRIFNIVFGGLNEIKLVKSKSCTKISFCNEGHLLAIADHSDILIYSFTTLNQLARLKAHDEKITGFDWKKADNILLSCDDHGVICEWDIVNSTKLWENTAITSYSSIAINQNDDKVFAIGRGQVLKCLYGSEVLSEIHTDVELTALALSYKGNAIYAGTAEGIILASTLSNLEKGTITEEYVHKGEVVNVKLANEEKLLITAGHDGLVSCWKTSEEDILKRESNLLMEILISDTKHNEQRKRVQQLELSLKQIENQSECELQHKEVVHEQELSHISLHHEQIIDAINAKIASIKQETQSIIWTSDSEKKLEELKSTRAKELVEATIKLDDAYVRSDVLNRETESMRQFYDKKIFELELKYKDSCMEISSIHEPKIQHLETNLAMEKQITFQVQLACKEFDDSVYRDIKQEVGVDDKKVYHLELETEKKKILQLRDEIQAGFKMLVFQKEETQEKWKKIYDQVDESGKRKFFISSLLKDVNQLESEVEAKEKVKQNQEVKFYECRKQYESLQNVNFVSRDTTAELKKEIQPKEEYKSKLEQEIKQLNIDIPKKKDLLLAANKKTATIANEHKSVVEAELVNKRKQIQEIQEMTSKYKAMLYKCTDEDCNAHELRENLLRLFEGNKNAMMEVTMTSADTDLNNEFVHQIENLQKSYNTIKYATNKVLGGQLMAEFEMAQRNSNILQDIHEIQEQVEECRKEFFEMEVCLGIPRRKAVHATTTKIGELQEKIEYAIKTLKDKSEMPQNELRETDEVILDQQTEILRLQTMILEKEANKQS